VIVALVSALLAAAQPVNAAEEEDPTFSERQPVRLVPLPAASALGAFRDICMSGFPDPGAFNAAAAASDLGFGQTPDTGSDTHEWSSRHGQIVLRTARRPERDARRDRRLGHDRRERWRERCDFWVAIEQRMEPAALVTAIGAELAPRSRPAEEILGVSWELESDVPGTSLRLVYLPSIDDPRIFTLSLQRLADSPR
jgi:hypothetical protein